MDDMAAILFNVGERLLLLSIRERRLSV